ncbi:MAG: alkaline phosphatase D family protein [Planctomycetota bacterium]
MISRRQTVSWFALVLGVCVLTGCVGGPPADVGPDPFADVPRAEQTVFAFGSCLKAGRPAPLFEDIIALDPDAWVMLGDNVYVDVPFVPRSGVPFDRKYAELAATDYWPRLTATTPVYAVWDDHDYGKNDAGREWGLKQLAKEKMFDFFGVPADHPARAREGVYQRYFFGEPGRRVQLILLDTRWFRDRLAHKRGEGARFGGPYGPTLDTTRTILGEAQWAWLEKVLREPADLRLIGSSIQVVSRQHGKECWGNFPHELDRLYATIAAAGAEGVVFVTGDRHHGELSRDTDDGTPYPMWDLTTSGINEKPRAKRERNRYRVGPVRRIPNYGVVRVDWSSPTPRVELSLRTLGDEVFSRAVVGLDELTPTLR